MKNETYSQGQVIEQLHFTVKPELIEKFIEFDAKIWTALLARQAGFIKKELWVGCSGNVYTNTYWKSLQHWQVIDKSLLEKTQNIFDDEIGKENYVFNKPLHVENQKVKVMEFTKGER